MKVKMINPLSGLEVSPEDPWPISCQVSRNLVRRLVRKEGASVKGTESFWQECRRSQWWQWYWTKGGQGTDYARACMPGKAMMSHTGVQELGTSERSGVKWSQLCFWKTTESRGETGPGTLLTQCTYLSMQGDILDLSNHIRVFQHNPTCLDYRMPFPSKLPSSSLSWLVFIESVLPPTFPTNSRPQALHSTTHKKLLLLNKLHIASLETWCDSWLWETQGPSHIAQSGVWINMAATRACKTKG